VGFKEIKEIKDQSKRLKPYKKPLMLASSGRLKSSSKQAIGALPRDAGEAPSRAEAVRHMAEFGEMHKLNLGERISRKILHEGHRY
jgi:hypothetical protein